METKIGFKGMLDCFEIYHENEPDYESKKIEEIIKDGNAKCIFKDQPNIITTIGKNIIANRLTGQSTYAAVPLQYFAVSDGSVAPTVSRTAANFYADGSAWYDKAVTSYEAFNTTTLVQQWNCYLTSVENDVASITKFALGNADPLTIMFNEDLFGAVSKDTSISLYFRYKLQIDEV